MEVGRGSGGGVGVLLELGFECGGAVLCGGFGGGALGGLLVELFLEAVDLGVGVGGSGLGAVGVVLGFLELCLEFGDPLARTLCFVGSGGMCLLQSVWSCSARLRCLRGFGG